MPDGDGLGEGGVLTLLKEEKKRTPKENG